MYCSQKKTIISLYSINLLVFVIDLECLPQFVLHGEGKAAPLQAWSGPERFRDLRFPDYKTTEQDVGKVVSFTHRPPLLPGNAPGTHVC